jgi:hypothetical protein
MPAGTVPTGFSKELAMSKRRWLHWRIVVTWIVKIRLTINRQ